MALVVTATFVQVTSILPLTRTVQCLAVIMVLVIQVHFSSGWIATRSVVASSSIQLLKLARDKIESLVVEYKEMQWTHWHQCWCGCSGSLDNLQCTIMCQSNLKCKLLVATVWSHLSINDDDDSDSDDHDVVSLTCTAPVVLILAVE